MKEDLKSLQSPRIIRDGSPAPALQTSHRSSPQSRRAVSAAATAQRAGPRDHHAPQTWLLPVVVVVVVAGDSPDSLSLCKPLAAHVTSAERGMAGASI